MQQSIKYALITGGSQGLGFSIAKYLAGKGYVPILLARTRNKLVKASEAIKALGFQAIIFPVDISNIDEITEVIDTVKQRFRKIDFLINNACVFQVETLENQSCECIKYNIDVGLYGAILVTKLCIPLLSDRSKILFVSSGFGLMGPAGYSIYSAIKAGVINFAESVRRELMSQGVDVYVTVPADIDTPGYHKEKESFPDWMKMSNARGKVMSAETAAQRIIEDCKGKRFFIFPHKNVYLFSTLMNIIPNKLRNYILDKSFPRP